MWAGIPMHGGRGLQIQLMEQHAFGNDMLKKLFCACNAIILLLFVMKDFLRILWMNSLI
jgi:hypothetical protein